eukprot:m.171665 g.171665  ORF g.171665 m.171665 type:complete len:774 (+) comp39065_c0_seq2:60-2381(+)
MGVLGLWQILGSCGRPVDLESLQGKILAVDVSLWLHQFAHGFQDKQGTPSANGHLLGLFHRLCKLLFYRIKPVFVFDGGVPVLKYQTMASRRTRRTRAEISRQQARENLLVNHVKRKALEAAQEKSKRPAKKVALPSKRQQKARDLFELPPKLMPVQPEKAEEEVEIDEIVLPEKYCHQDVMTVNVHSDDFRALSLEIQHELIVAIQEESKMNHWRTKSQLPKVAGDFSGYQLQRLRKRGQLTQRLDTLRKEMATQESAASAPVSASDGSSSGVLSSRIASDEQARFLLIKGSGMSSAEDSQETTENEEVAISILSSDSDSDSELMSLALEKGIPSRRESSLLKPLESSSKDVAGSCSITLDLSKSDGSEPSRLFPADLFQTFKPTLDSGVKRDDIENSVCSEDIDVGLISEESMSSSEEEKEKEEGVDVVTDAKVSERSDVTAVKDEERGTAVSVLDEETESRQLDVIAEEGEDGLEALLDSEMVEPSRPDLASIGEAFTGKQLSLDGKTDEKETIEAVGDYLEKEKVVLEKESARQERRAAGVTNEMYMEGMELLRLFGVPYVQAPMEAEAQCAWLDFTNQTEGTITDDGDIFLFNGQRVYKNIFRHDKDAEKYSAKDVKDLLGLDREKLVDLALLLGSDYTTGIQGVGGKTALEIMKYFDDKGDCLKVFRDWWERVKNKNLLETTKESRIERRMRRLDLPASFPDEVVRQAYLKPAVDESEEPFEWGIPDLDALRDYASRTFGWAKNRLDEVVLPVLQKLNSREDFATKK